MCNSLVDLGTTVGTACGHLYVMIISGLPNNSLLWSKSMFGQGGSSAPIFVSDIGREFVKKRTRELMNYKKIIEEPYY